MSLLTYTAILKVDLKYRGAKWSIGGVDAFRPKGRGFESRSSRHVGQVIHSQLLVAFRRANSDTVSIPVVGSVSERLML